MSFVYLGALLVSLAGMVVLDLRFRLFFAVAPVRAAIVLVAGIAFFLVWDVAGIGAGIFFRGNPGLLTGVLIGPELPLEELFFLALLCYLTMNLYGWLRSAAQRRVSKPGVRPMTYWLLNLPFLARRRAGRPRRRARPPRPALAGDRSRRRSCCWS